MILVISLFLSQFTCAAEDIDLDQIPPEGSKKIYQVLEFLEKKGIDNVIKVNFDDWIWKAVSLQDNIKTHYYISPKNLLIFKTKEEFDLDIAPPSIGKSITDILHLVEETGYRDIRKIAFENYVWKVKTFNAKREENKFILDPLTGAVIYKNAKHKKIKPYDVYGLVLN